MFPWSADAQAARSLIEADANVAAEVSTSQGPLSPDDITSSAAAGWPSENVKRLQPKLEWGERIRSEDFQLVGVPAVDVTYSIGGQTSDTVRLQGRRMLAPPAGAAGDRMSRLARRARRVRAIALGAAIGVAIAYLLRGDYFFNRIVLAVVLGGLAASLLVARFFDAVLLNRETSARRWASVIAGVLVLTGALAAMAEPTVRAAKGYLAKGELDAARRELLAIGKLQTVKTEAAWADLRLADALRSEDRDVVRGLAEKMPAGTSQRDSAIRHLFELTDRDVRVLVSKRWFADAKQLVSGTVPALSQGSSPGAYDARVTDMRGRILDEEFNACDTDPCRWRAALTATRETPTPQRAARLEEVRDRLNASLTFQPMPKEGALARLKRLRGIMDLSTTISEMGLADALVDQARSAAAAALDERMKVPLVGSDRSTAAELLELEDNPSATYLSTVVSSVSVYANNRGGRCAGVYVVGNGLTARVLNDETRGAVTARLLSQAIGRKVPLPEPPKPAGGKSPLTSRWSVAGTPILARWRDNALIELRIGELTL